MKELKWIGLMLLLAGIFILAPYVGKWIIEYIRNFDFSAKTLTYGAVILIIGSILIIISDLFG